MMPTSKRRTLEPGPGVDRGPEGDGALPNLVIIGAQKCGTTALHGYLALHPEIGMSRVKELTYYNHAPRTGRDEAWYRSWFDPTKAVRGESSPAYTHHPTFEGIAERMHASIPDARLIYLVRDPLSRTLAHYRHYVAERREDRPANEVLAEPESPYVLRSCYAFQIERYLRFYSREQILIVEQEALLRDRLATLAHVFEWLGVDPTFRSVRFRRRPHRTARKRRRSDLGERLSRTAPMRALERLPDPAGWMLKDLLYAPFSRAVPTPTLDPWLVDALQARFAKDVERLRELTGRGFASWSV